MVELVMTDEEKTKNWDALSDADMATMARYFLIKYNEFHKSDGGSEPMIYAAAALTLVTSAVKTNSETLTITIENVTMKDKEIGDWEIVVTVKNLAKK